MNIEIIIVGTIIFITNIIAIILLLKQKNRDYSESLIEIKTQISMLAEQFSKELSNGRIENGNSFKTMTETTTNTLDTFSRRLQQFSSVIDEKFDRFNTNNENRLNSIRETLDNKMKLLQDENSKKLEEMRLTVDERLQKSVEKRFNDSFKMISERLELVHKSMGEMQTLATGVGDLKRVLTNVKTRGGLGEIQLGAILEQCLSPEQYLVNAQVKENSSERVEFAVKLPGSEQNSSILLPIDSKFPLEDYQRLLDAYDNDTSIDELKKISTMFESAVKRAAQDIKNKYINPPTTTDFAVMFVPTEGLYAEILRRAGLFENLQRNFKITVVGPANLVAFLNSLQMGFRTLAIQKRSSEVWSILGAVKSEFGKFGDVLEKTRSKLESAVKEIDSAGVRSRAIERKLRGVEELPEHESIEDFITHN